MSTIDKHFFFFRIHDIFDNSLPACQYINISCLLGEGNYAGEVCDIFNGLQQQKQHYTLEHTQSLSIQDG